MAEYRLDLSGYDCPLPLLMTKKALNSLAVGDSLTLVLNRSVAVEDFRLLCRQLHCRWQAEQQFEHGFQLTLCKQPG